MAPDISIVIPTWNGLALLRENLPSVQEAARLYSAETGARCEIIVVDDGSRDSTVATVPIEFPEVRLVVSPRNLGFAGACNLGFQEVRYPIIALLNNDVRLHPRYLFYKAEHFEDPEVFAVTAKVLSWDSPLFNTGGRYGKFRRGFWSVYFNYNTTGAEAETWTRQRKLLSAYAIGGFSTYRSDRLRELGGFNPLLSPFHWEDVDLSYRGWKRGWEIRYEPRSVAHHRTSATIDAHYRKRFVDAVSFRNRLLFHWINIHSPSYLAAHLIMLLLLCLSRIFVLDLYFYRSLYGALENLPAALECRRREKKSARSSDREISRRLSHFYRTAPIRIFYDQDQVKAFYSDFTEAEA